MAHARNLELKAHDPDPLGSLHAALALGASDEGRIWQRDTYFVVAHGRLKLREQDPGPAQLVQYVRAESPGERESAYRVCDVDSAPLPEQALGFALGVKVVVVKQRRLLLWHGVRIHLDDVEQLGTFVELEAVLDEDASAADAEARLARLRDVLKIGDHRLEASGYADQMIRRSVSEQMPVADALAWARAGAPAELDDVRCSFCGKRRAEVETVIGGPAGVAICDECVDLAGEIIAEECPEHPG